MEGWKYFQGGAVRQGCSASDFADLTLCDPCAAFHSACFPTCTNYTCSTTQLHTALSLTRAENNEFTPSLSLSVHLIGLPATNLLFHIYQIGGRHLLIKPTQAVLPWNNFLLEELSSHQKSPVFVQGASLRSTEFHPKAFTMAVRDQQFIDFTSGHSPATGMWASKCVKLYVNTGSENKELKVLISVKMLKPNQTPNQEKTNLLTHLDWPSILHSNSWCMLVSIFKEGASLASTS